jgi:hypothetical protein
MNEGADKACIPSSRLRLRTDCTHWDLTVSIDSFAPHLGEGIIGGKMNSSALGTTDKISRSSTSNGGSGG